MIYSQKVKDKQKLNKIKYFLCKKIFKCWTNKFYKKSKNWWI